MLILKGSTPILRTTLRTAGGAQRNFAVFHAKKTPNPSSPLQLAELYNAVTNPQYEAGLKVTEECMRMRLERDPESVLVGLMDNTLSALINVVKLQLNDLKEIPPTHQQLTGNDTFSTTKPDDCTFFICPWVASSAASRGLKGVISGRLKSVGQIMAAAVGVDARAHGRINAVVAYSRPAQLREHLSRSLGQSFTFLPNPSKERLEIRDAEGKAITPEPAGITRNGESIFTFESYVNERIDGRRIDPVLNMHLENGARWTGIVFPHGQIFDFNSFGYRTLLAYDL